MQSVLRLSMVAIGLVSASLVGCVARRVAPPPRPGSELVRVNLRPLKLYLREFVVEGRSTADTPARVEALQDRFLDFLEGAAEFEEVGYDLNGKAKPTAPALEVRVEIGLTSETERTYLLDAVNIACLGGWPLVPAWGDAEAALTVTVAPYGGPLIATYRETVRAPYSALFFGWYRRGYVEAAFRRAFAEAFRKIARALPADVAAYRSLTAALSETPPMTVATDIPETPPAAAPAEAATPTAWTDANVTELPAEGFHIVREAPSTPIDGSLAGYLGILGGVEVSGLYGAAKVSSSANLASGATSEVAHGNATEHGFRISLYSAPKATGAFISPIVGYVNQQIDNVDARSSLSQLNTLSPERGDIPAVATDPDTGGAVDAGAADIYHLEMQSGYGGFRAGFDLVSGTADVEAFMSLSLGVNLVEYRKIRSVLDQCGSDVERSACSSSRQGWDFLKSGAVGGTLGLRVPSWHTSLRVILDYEIYREFLYDHPLGVRGPPVYDPATGLFSHEMVSMRGASLTSFVAELALGMVF